VIGGDEGISFLVGGGADVADVRFGSWSTTARRMPPQFRKTRREISDIEG
jgi:hypothetical protein